MYPFYNVQPLFPFWGPFLFGRRRRRLNTISGIPVLKTTGVVATSTEVRYDVNYQEYRSLPNEGLFFLDVRQSSAEASASLPVGLSDGNSENNNQSMLRNALQEDVQAGDLQLNFRYLIYYNKCNNVYQLVNAYPVMLFNQLNIGDKVYIIEVVGTFKKTTEYNEGSVTQVSSIYDEPLPPGQFPMPNQPRKKVVDITIQCNGETKKFTIPENKSVITDNSIGLTISTDKQEIINIVRNQYDTYKQRKEAIAKCDEEMAKCQALLNRLGINDKPAKENDEIIALQKEVNELKNIIRKANQMVPPPMKEMLPQDMKNAMDKVGQ